METPIWSYRVAPKNRAILRRVADGLKRDPKLAQALKAVLGTRQKVSTSIGPFRDEEAALGFIRDRLVFSLKPESVWLFGSRARGGYRPDSDFDILVVLPDDLGDRARDHRYVAEPLLASGLPCDVVPCSQSDFEAARNELGTIAYEAFHAGRPLYERQRRRRVA